MMTTEVSADVSGSGERKAPGGGGGRGGADLHADVHVVRYVAEDQISLVEVLAAVLRHRYAILACMAATAFLGVVLLLLSFSPTYTAEASFMPQGGNSGSASRLEAMAGRFGFEVPSGTGIASPAFYANLLDSREILRPLLTDTLSVGRAEEPDAPSEGTLLELLRLEDLDEAVAREEGIKWLRSVTDESVEPTTGVIHFSVTTPWPGVSEGIASRLLERVNEFNLQTLRSQAAAERQFLQERVAEAQEELLAAEEELKRFLQTNRTFDASPDLTFEHERLQRQVAVRQQLFTSLGQSYDQARVSEVRNTPVITVLDRPVEPVNRNPRGLKRRAFLGLMLGGVLGVLWALGREFLQRGSTEASADLAGLLRAWKEGKAGFGRLGSAARRLLGRS